MMGASDILYDIPPDEEKRDLVCENCNKHFTERELTFYDFYGWICNECEILKGEDL